MRSAAEYSGRTRSPKVENSTGNTEGVCEAGQVASLLFDEECLSTRPAQQETKMYSQFPVNEIREMLTAIFPDWASLLIHKWLAQ